MWGYTSIGRHMMCFSLSTRPLSLTKYSHIYPATQHESLSVAPSRPASRAQNSGNRGQPSGAIVTVLLAGTLSYVLRTNIVRF